MIPVIPAINITVIGYLMERPFQSFALLRRLLGPRHRRHHGRQDGQDHDHHPGLDVFYSESGGSRALVTASKSLPNNSRFPSLLSPPMENIAQPARRGSSNLHGKHSPSRIATRRRTYPKSLGLRPTQSGGSPRTKTRLPFLSKQVAKLTIIPLASCRQAQASTVSGEGSSG